MLPLEPHIKIVQNFKGGNEASMVLPWQLAGQKIGTCVLLCTKACPLPSPHHQGPDCGVHIKAGNQKQNGRGWHVNSSLHSKNQ